MQKCISLAIEARQLNTLEKSEFLSISLDEGSDCSNNNLLSIIIYYLDENFALKNLCLGLPKIYQFDAGSIASTVITLL